MSKLVETVVDLKVTVLHREGAFTPEELQKIAGNLVHDAIAEHPDELRRIINNQEESYGITNVE